MLVVVLGAEHSTALYSHVIFDALFWTEINKYVKLNTLKSTHFYFGPNLALPPHLLKNIIE